VRKTLAGLALLAASLALAPAPFPRPERRGKPATGLAGEWGGPHRLVIEPGQATFYRSRPYQYALRLDATASPPGYTLRPTGPGGAELSGIYKVEGDVLTLSYHPAGRERPTAFEGPGSGTYTAVYKRVKR
jgi:hypothetical protein